MLEFVILGMVIDDDLTGYDIKRSIENGIGVFYKASFGSLYPALKKCTEKGFLTTYEKPNGGRKKVYHHITEAGRERFFSWLSSPTEVLDGTNTSLAKTYFFDRLPRETRDRQLFQLEQNHIKYLKKLTLLENQFKALENAGNFYYKLSTLYYGIAITQKTIEWCRHIREQKPLDQLTGGKHP